MSAAAEIIDFDPAHFAAVAAERLRALDDPQPPAADHADSSTSDEAVTRANDSLTVLRSLGPRMTKTWAPSGIQQYDRARNFTVRSVEFDGIEGLASALEAVSKDPRSCVIRGQLRDDATPREDGTYERNLETFTERARKWVCFDIDNWVDPTGGDPVTQPEIVIDRFVSSCLPVEFRGVSYWWQLSSSAGKPGSANVLKAHIWFVLDRPVTGDELDAWARALNLIVDVTTFRTVQVHFVAAPVFDGVEDPVPVRSGIWLSPAEIDEVAIVLPDVSQLPTRQRPGRHDLVDPTLKPGLIGAFCRLYPPAILVDSGLVPGYEFEGDSDVRLTWTTSASGAAGGACITDDGHRIFNAHNDDPAKGRAVSSWDFMRLNNYGYLDDDLDEDAISFIGVDKLPSELAMRQFVKDSLPDVVAEWERTRAAEREARAERVRALHEEAARRGQQHLQLVVPDAGAADGPDEAPEPSGAGEAGVPQAAASDAPGGSAAPSAGTSEIVSRAPRGEIGTRPLKVLTISELMSQKPARWLVKGLVPEASLGLLYGASGAGKTFIVADLALAVARGMEWRGRRVKQTGVLYVAAEAQYSIGNRLRAYSKHHKGVNLSTVPFGILPESLSLSSEGKLDAARLVHACRAMQAAGQPVGLIVLDTLNRVMSGADENSSSDMGSLIANVDAIRAATGATVLIVHHSGKDEDKGARGHSSLKAAVDVEIQVTRNGNARGMKVTKSRDGADGDTHAFRLERVVLGRDDDGDEESSCVVVHEQGRAPVVPWPPGKWMDGIRRVLLDADDEGVDKAELPGLVKALVDPDNKRGRDSVNRAIKDLAGQSLILDKAGRWVLPDPLAA
ncbi:MAG: AAA family ATPase [Burkholderiales bacterium]|nr:AAA family ATPase [Burkholderiales bacterium]